MCVLGQPEHVNSVLTFPCGYNTLEYSWVKATAVSVRLRILFVTLQNTNNYLCLPRAQLALWGRRQVVTAMSVRYEDSLRG